MALRKDGEQTRRKILEAACQVFAEKGFRDATHTEICELAGANTAAINYHFGAKAELYRAAWAHAADLADELYPEDGGVPATASAAERLQGRLRSLAHRMADETNLRLYHRARRLEMINPTGLLDELVAKRIGRARQEFSDTLREYLGPNATDKDIELCEISVIGPCLAVGPVLHESKLGVPWRLTPADADQIADHIVQFAMAGLRAARREIRDRPADRMAGPS